MRTKAQRRAMANALRKQHKRYHAGKFFAAVDALNSERSPEARKQKKKLAVQYHGKRFPHPGLYWAPRGAISAR